MKVSKDLMIDYAYEGDYMDEPFKLILEEDYDQGRWEMTVRQILQHVESGKFYETFYRRGLTECQETSPYEYDNEDLDLTEVFPKEVKKVVYER